MFCTECGFELIEYRQSAPIPKKKNWYYISCDSCSNIMRAEIVDIGIICLESTSKKKGLKIQKEIALALKLFAEKGHYSFGYSVYDTENLDVALYKKKSIIGQIKDFYKTVF